MIKIIFIDKSDSISLPEAPLIQSLFGRDEIVVVTCFDAAFRVLENNNIPILVTNSPNLELLRWRRKNHPTSQNILCTTKPMAYYSKVLNGEEIELIDHVIANRLDSFWTIFELRITAAKILNPKDIFGISKYLSESTHVFSEPVTGSKDRDPLNNAVMKFALDCKLGHHTAKMAFGITEELLMNTIHDAPLAAGIEEHVSQVRSAPVVLRAAEYGKLSYGCDGRIFAIGVEDPFGALAKDKLFQYLTKVLRRKDSVGLIDTKEGGAGLGFFKILYSSHGIICNVLPGQRTEVISLMDVNEQLRDFALMPRSIHYFTGQA